MIAITKDINEANTNYSIDQAGRTVVFDPKTGQNVIVPANLAQQATTKQYVVNPDVRPVVQQAPVRTVIQQVPVAPVRTVVNQDVQPIDISRGARVARQMSPQYREDLRQTFNSLPNRGRDLQIAGTGQIRPVIPAHQQQFDERYRQIVTNRQPAGVPARQAQQAVPVDTPPPTVPATIPVKQAVKAVSADDISGSQAAGIALKKGAKAAGEAIGSGANKAMEFAGDHPLAGGIVAGAAGALGLKRLLNRNRPA